MKIFTQKSFFIAFAVLFLAGFFFFAPATDAATIIASGTISTATTWTANNVYDIPISVTVGSGGTLTVNSSTVVKIEPNAFLQVNAGGALKANGTSTGKIYFTAYDDDSVGGDTNGDGTSTTPHAGDAGCLMFMPGASTTLTSAVIRYGGSSNCIVAGTSKYADLYVGGGTTTLSSVTIASSSNYGINIEGGNLTITTSTFSNNGQYAIYETNSTGTITLTTSTFTNNTVGAGYFDITNNATLIPSGNMATSSGGDRGFTMNGVMSGNQTWYKDLPYIINNLMTVSSGTTLTVKPGAIIKFGVTVPLTVDGTLNAQGTTSSLVYFTSLTDDGVGGDTNGDGTSTIPAKGDSGYIQIDPGASSTITYSTVTYGTTFSPTSDIYQLGGNLTLSHDTVASSSGYGIQTQGGTLSISTSTLSNNAIYGLYEYNSTGSIILASSTFANNANRDAYLDFGNGLTFTPSGNNVIGTTSTGSGVHGFTAVTVSANLTKSVTWLKDLPYVLPGNNFYIDSGATLTVNHGVVLKLDGLGVAALTTLSGGTLNIQGTAADGVYFTSLTDDSIGGDTNADGGGTTPQPGDGGSIETDSGGNSTIAYSIVRYGGVWPRLSNIYSIGGSVVVTNSTVASSSNYGLYISSGTLSFFNSAATTDAIAGINNTSNVTSTASVENNWWGDSRGPYNANLNPNTSGTPVSDWVDFIPWLTTPPVSNATSFYAQIKNASSGRWLMRSTPASSSDANDLKRLPDDWVVFVSSTVSATGSPIVANGYRWYDVVDPTDGSEGWMAATSSAGVTFLSYVSSTQLDLQATSSISLTSLTTPTRATFLLNAIGHYYNNAATSASLYSSDDGINNDISLLSTRSFAQALVWGIAADEDGPSFDNTIVTKDYGHGIMQITPYLVWAHEPTSTLGWKTNTENVPANGSYLEIFPCRSFDEFATPATGTDIYIKCYTDGGTGSSNPKPYKAYEGNPAVTYKWYANTSQSIYANVKDGMRTLQDKFQVTLPSPITTSTTASGTVYTGIQREAIIITAAYNGTGTVACSYVNDVATKLDTINTYFAGTNSSTVSSTVRAMHKAGQDNVCAQLHSPGDLSITDSSGKTIGIVNGQEKNDFLWGVQDPQQKWVQILFAPDENYSYKVVGTGNGVYGLDIIINHGPKQTVFHAKEIPITPNEIHTYTVDQAALLSGQAGVTLSIDKHGDGVIDKTVTAGATLTGSDLTSIPSSNQ